MLFFQKHKKENGKSGNNIMPGSKTAGIVVSFLKVYRICIELFINVGGRPIRVDVENKYFKAKLGTSIIFREWHLLI